MHLFYTPDIRGNEYTLDESESKHAVRVLRLQEGDEVVLVDGRGGWYRSRISKARPKACLLLIEEQEERTALPYRLHIAMAPTKNIDRFEWFLEKATEIGITAVTPLICQRSERRQLKPERLERILVSAMKQSLKAHLPRLHPVMDFSAFLSQEYAGEKAIAHCMEGEKRGMKALAGSPDLTVLVGPEGDFTEAEVEQAAGAGFRPLDLGKSRLRTETAGLHICSAMQFLHEV